MIYVGCRWIKYMRKLIISKKYYIYVIKVYVWFDVFLIFVDLKLYGIF